MLIWQDFKLLIWTICVLAGTAFGVKTCAESEWQQERERQRAAKRAADATPRVVNRFDGCEVWAFKPTTPGHWTYVTKCPGASVTTDSGHTVSRRKRDIVAREITTTKEN
jgi:hypothetical protein